ncbi:MULTISPECIES: PRD domain-containing protein [Clostridium]|jgi:beta-glucoside operon transcriptional antiterminator|uniref:BglG family transcriptional antiterminator n=2 Tax=root TaxID=1 RepID=R9CF14_9CLOT|nr:MULTISPECIES: PRD domain-containing protein [Clostridium]EOR27872.1 BglG family transcriptional antiterminator [Clostridium sartagoforme AAU1]KLE14889.1 transcription antiterminator LicT [Clostridium sp. C8]
MIINKVLNNNVITIINENNEESVVMGRGIAFQKKKGDEIDQEKVDKIFVLKNKSINDKLIALVNDISVENLEIAEEVIKYAEKKLDTKLNENIYLTLTDHISFSINRYKSNLEMKNVMLWDIKRLHKAEFEVGLKALEIIKNRINIELPEDEAASIAMHILNGELSQDMPQIVDIINLINEILKIVKYHFNVDFDEESINYYRFITHLKFFAQRLVNGKYYEDNDNDLFEMIKNKYPKSYECTRKIEGFIKQKFNNELTKEEKLYLIVHTARVVKENY